ncbi:nucleotide exchange factor SIL1 [Hyalella azteca]|uniref:Nucleotide exchange factor SIL1 n=1 Tax=Hyalella azteca TaxID=294128 RepID=A0A8B7NC19_HYAAZ|nr:nucleotide exchange factor SIL1 [Hyalella azteca]
MLKFSIFINTSILVILCPIILVLCGLIEASERGPKSTETFSSLAITSDIAIDLEEDETVKTDFLQNINPKKIFIPSTEWKVIDADHVVLPGLHYRMNLETGMKEARLMEGDDGSKYLASAKQWLQKHKVYLNNINDFQADKFLSDVHKENLYLKTGNEKGNLEDFMNDVRKIDDSQRLNREQDDGTTDEPVEHKETSTKSFRTYEELKEELAALNLIMESEQNIVAKKILDHYGLETDDERLESLADLEYLLHNIDNAQTFIDHGGFSKVTIPALNSTSWELRRAACRLLSACVQNFPKGQISAYEAGLVQRLIAMLIADPEATVRSAALSSVSSLVRHFPLAQQQFIALGSHAVKATLFSTTDASAVLRRKMINLLSDLLMERAETSLTEDRLSQLEAVKLEESLASMGWCSLISQQLELLNNQLSVEASELERGSIEHNLDSVLHVVEASPSVCSEELRNAVPALRKLAALQDVFSQPTHHNLENEDLEDESNLRDDNSEVVDRIQRIIATLEHNRSRQEL